MMFEDTGEAEGRSYDLDGLDWVWRQGRNEDYTQTNSETQREGASYLHFD